MFHGALLMKKENCDKIFYAVNGDVFSILIVTNFALIQMQNLISKYRIFGLRLNIRKSGCAGYTYKIEKIKNFSIHDVVYKNKNCKINLCVPNNLNLYINNTKIDYIKKNFNYTFTFDNKNILQKCGCGKSFNMRALYERK
ncbi:MAG: Iron-binding protein IscA [Candidatus Westeberhardia cardiocondylae]|nr:Iron-binding protein IscA [Candidatus Westeberhardia cardiocondylae]